MKARSGLCGKAFENWGFHELKSHSQYAELFYELSHWRLTTGQEVDFIVDDMQIAIEAKSSKHIDNRHLKGLRELTKDYPQVKQRIVVCLENKERVTDDGIRILPAKLFCEFLWGGEIAK